MFSYKRLAIPLAMVMILSLLLAACGPTPEPQVVEKIVTQVVEVEKIVEKEGEQVTIIETQIVEVEKEVEVIVEATPEPVERQGAWLDTIIVVEEPSADAA
jgi:ABC-type uncharacterized transport system auxiliary subunit